MTERTRQLFEEKQKTEDLLHRMLPPSVARKLTHGIAVEPESFTGERVSHGMISVFPGEKNLVSLDRRHHLLLRHCRLHLHVFGVDAVTGRQLPQRTVLEVR